MNKFKLFALIGFLFTFNVVLNATTIKVSDQASLNAAIKSSLPGDTIVMSSGEWKNTKIVFENNGTAAHPIVLAAADAGKTILTGNSSLRFAGNYLEVNGLWFTDGYTDNAAIEFRKNDKVIANHCRLTNCAIDNYNKPDRFNADSWIIMWGKYNRIDHCTIGDKLNAGTTLIINLNDERSQQNYHSIDSNHFYKHSPLGSNGGETIRVGVSRYSLTSSNTIIAHNYFEKCSGEVEIISVKSCYNKVYQNTFYECEGGLVLRHGNHNEIEGNLFLGNNKPHTGGIRVINPDHIVMNNLILNCAGNRFRSALGVLNGVPNSQLNRYFQVKDTRIEHNSFINCSSIVFGAGKDHERTAAPVNVLFSNNYIDGSNGYLMEDMNKDGGILLKSNFTSNKLLVTDGFTNVSTRKMVWHGLTFNYPVNSNAGADLNKVGFVQREKTGAYWYKPNDVPLAKGTTIKVSINQSKSLPDIIQKVSPNDTIILTDTGKYEINATLSITKPIAIVAYQNAELVNVAEKSLATFISIENGGSLYIKGVAFNSAYKSYGDVQSAVASAEKNMAKHYTLKMVGCEFYNFNENNYACYKANKSTYADSVVFENCIFRNMSGNAIELAAEKEDKGIYNAEYVMVRNCSFSNMLAGAINIYRGGNDESTTGPYVIIDHCVFDDVDNREQGCVIKLLGVQYARVTNSVFTNCGQGGRSVWFEELGWDDVLVDYCNFDNAGKVESFHGKLFGAHNLSVKPSFEDALNHRYKASNKSALIGKASDGVGNIGIQ